MSAGLWVALGMIDICSPRANAQEQIMNDVIVNCVRTAMERLVFTGAKKASGKTFNFTGLLPNVAVVCSDARAHELDASKRWFVRNRPSIRLEKIFNFLGNRKDFFRGTHD